MTCDHVLVALPLAAILVCSGAADRPAVAADNAPQVAEKKVEKASTNDSKQDHTSTKKNDPFCMHCGATCGLQPICVCELGTKKQPKVEFDTTCEPICIPACGSRVWPFGGRTARVGCTSHCEDPCVCAGRVRYCKKIQKQTVDEELSTVVRKVTYVCDLCAGGAAADCCGNEQRRQREPAWWIDLTWWWPRKPAADFRE